VVGALALAVAGTGIGYAVGVQRGGTASAGGLRGSASSELLPGSGQGGYGYGYGGYGGFGGQQFGQQSGQGFGGPQLGQGFGGAQSPGTRTGDTSTRATASQLRGLVRIVSTLKYDGGEAAGTGMVLTSDGEVVTNHHVVAGATSVAVTVMSTGKTYSAQVVGTDTNADVAVLQLQGASGLTTITADTHAVTKGEKVTAVGDGNGADQLSAATGQVVATDQSITTQSEGSAAGESLSDLIEISSDVVSGDSGGATYDSDGQVLGMTTAASSGSSDVVGYAIPISTVLTVADDLESGVRSSDYAYGYPAFLGVGLSSGTTVQQVYDATPADEAGIVPGDWITKIDGTATTTEARLRSAIAAHQPGDRVSLTWVGTNGSTHSATVTLAKGPVS
jgi:S1-C subfamily serine protease